MAAEGSNRSQPHEPLGAAVSIPVNSNAHDRVSHIEYPARPAVASYEIVVAAPSSVTSRECTFRTHNRAVRPLRETSYLAASRTISRMIVRRGSDSVESLTYSLI
jgi:hypothetical protein